jgi:hypothetical protein
LNDEISTSANVTPKSPASETPSPAIIGAVTAWAIVVVIAGGLGIGWLLAWRVYGNIVFLALGYVAGIVAQKLAGRPRPWSGWTMVAAMLGAFYIAEAAWLYFDEIEGAETFFKAMLMVPRLPSIATGAFLIGLFCACVGARTAYQIAGSRWRYLMVRD